MQSAIYTGKVRHRRFKPTQNAFKYGLFMMYLDLQEVETLFQPYWLWSAARPNIAWLRRTDHLGSPDQPLIEAVRDLVERDTGSRPNGPIRLLTHMRYFGFCFNPVSFYYCFDALDRKVETVVAEINNTPWGEQHCYVLPRNDSSQLHFEFGKEFHVSPFMPMTIQYDWRFGEPGKHISVHINNHQQGEKLFDATLELTRREINGFSLARVLCAYPVMTLWVVLLIYWQALRLYLKRTPFYAHPTKTEP